MSTTLTIPVATIRALTLEELPLCETFGRAFHAEKQLDGDFLMDTFLRNWTMILTTLHGTILGLWSDERLMGGLGAMIAPDLSDDRRTATEMFWYVTPEARHGRDAFRLLDAYEVWAREQGAVECRITHLLMPGEDPAHVRLGPIYRRKAYRAVEVNYVKPLLLRSL